MLFYVFLLVGLKPFVVVVRWAGTKATCASIELCERGANLFAFAFAWKQDDTSQPGMGP